MWTTGYSLETIKKEIENVKLDVVTVTQSNS